MAIFLADDAPVDDRTVLLVRRETNMLKKAVDPSLATAGLPVTAFGGPVVDG